MFIFWNISLWKQSPVWNSAFYCTKEVLYEGYLIENFNFISWRDFFPPLLRYTKHFVRVFLTSNWNIYKAYIAILAKSELIVVI